MSTCGCFKFRTTSLSKADPELTSPIPGTDGWEVEWFDEIESTNTYLALRATQGQPEGLVAVANYQSAGRGRLSRSWEATKESSLLTSFLLRPTLALSECHLIVMGMSVAITRTVSELYGVNLKIKWPNDIVHREVSSNARFAKLAGILSEVVTPRDPGFEGLANTKDQPVSGSNESYALVIGIGLNLNWTKDQLAGAKFSSPPGALSEIIGGRVDRKEIFYSLARKFYEIYADIDSQEQLNRVLEEYRSKCDTIGRQISVDSIQGNIQGQALDVATDGRLLVDTGACIARVSIGDVMELGPQE